MKAIFGYWALDGVPDAGALTAMRHAGVHCAKPHLTQWSEGSLGFGASWWSPQSGLLIPKLIARHPETGCVAVADARLDESDALRHALEIPLSVAMSAVDLILLAWLRWGDNCAERIDGDFAFAIYDPRKSCLFLARDRMAGRPLYVHYLPGKLLAFGSSSPAVLAHPRVPHDLNEARIADFLIEGLEGVDFTSTFHLAIERLPPRHTLLVTPEKCHLSRYWQLEPGCIGPLPKGDDEWAEALTAAMERAVAQRLAGPERVGSMLSGGLDSTSLAIIAGEQLQRAGRTRLPTFSAIHSGLPGCKETEAVCQLLDMPIFEPYVTDLADLGDRFPRLLTFLDEFDEPFDANMSLLDAQYLAAAEAGVDSVIDGVDGDGLFSAGDALRRQIRSGHWIAARENARGLARIHGGQPWQHLLPAARSAIMPAWLRRLLWPMRSRHRRRHYVEQSLIAPEFAERIRLEERLERLRALRSLSPLPAPEPEAAEALMHTFPVVGLERYYRVAARHGVTPLHPFTERRLLELCVHFPDRQRLRDGWSKPILRHAMSGRMPEPVRLRVDKQHLGWRLELILWGHRGPEPPPNSRELCSQLSTWIGSSQAEMLIRQLDGPARDPALGRLLCMYALGRWLSRGGGCGLDGGPIVNVMGSTAPWDGEVRQSGGRK
ncbi:asparagine synthase-related protein [Pseudoxanthomonas koreensis]|uniref:asparagine synthase-related protein n=1 Tax=Pseudoxanthomonas koreensis TaxID=266061 RepID=UPI001390C67E|nr:asparagine synthase-related protein [Pseudoxanthomonas koreensis]KAF1695317.1 hypothetical protein CSC64_03455 [Pseudoxanthomonas koreensis]